LRDRFGVSLRLEFYSVPDLEKILARTAGILGVQLTAEGGREVAQRSRGTPRIANRLLRRVRDFAQVKAKGVIDTAVASDALTLLEVDPKGLDSMDRQILLTIIEKFDGGPVGIETLSASIGEERDTLEEVYEPYLLQEGYLARTPRGRMATKLSYQLLGLRAPAKPEPISDLFERESLKSE
jgi:Holliday junction DNA helicase RuvB